MSETMSEQEQLVDEARALIREHEMAATANETIDSARGLAVAPQQRRVARVLGGLLAIVDALQADQQRWEFWSKQFEELGYGDGRTFTDVLQGVMENPGPDLKVI